MPTMCVTNVAEYPVNKLGTQSVFALEWKNRNDGVLLYWANIRAHMEPVFLQDWCQHYVLFSIVYWRCK